MAIKVTLRRKPIGNGKQSLYLDFYPAIKVSGSDKTTRRKFLKLHIPEKANTTILKQDKKRILLIAEQIRQKWDNELNKPEVYSAFELEQLKLKEKGEQSFIVYYEQLMKKRDGNNYDVWFSAFHYLKEFTNGNLKFSDLNEKFCNDYKYYLLHAKSRRSKTETISQNSARSYFNKFKATLKQAFVDDLLLQDLNSKITPIKEASSERVFLTLEELNLLVQTNCDNAVLKQAALFSALTGLRHSDIVKLIWGEVIKNDTSNYSIHFQQKKTKSHEYFPISVQAYDLLGERKDPSMKVFEGLKYSARENEILLKWVKDAGVQKHVTFHCFRHTYATLQLVNGTDIYTVSKMLGHKDLKTTQIYAKVVDEAKQATTNKIILDL
ncbi:site-specific integrase [Aestuariibaculum sp. M13]|uniref:site-specific integrase n=1 Tax=Aestuariibaculum sp. M13 TaxID=2967132 RepID=UPI002159EB0D|nr:site-specific integrase [Aestuariibaculum sp. M13]MCR8667898.1 site-specific integrase [Aestuariibaculum sp. M13]